jgi:hypothetical protein
MKTCFAIPWALALGLTSITASAADVSISGFGTVGYAQSDQPYAYQRYIDNNGTFQRDSVFGLQLDAKLTEKWSATVQAKVAPSLSNDAAWDPTVSWAFVSYRPTDDWLFRVGKLRVPLYLNSENMDVGTTFDFARLPSEMYSIAPTSDFTGASFTKTWSHSSGDLSLDGYWGTAKSHWRLFMRDDLSAIGGLPRGANFLPITTEAKGLVLTAQVDEHRFRAGIHKTITKRSDGLAFVSDFPYGNLLSPLPVVANGYQAQGPTVPSVSRVHNTVYTLGADVALGNGYRLMGEYARRVIDDTKIGPDASGAYISLLKESGAWTPYVSASRLQSSSGPRDLYLAVNGNTISAASLIAQGMPAFMAVPTAAGLTASQRAVADGIVAYDQSTLAIGTSYKLSPTQKIKAEWARTHVGAMSSFIDAPSGTETGRRNINVYSVSYNFVF